MVFMPVYEYVCRKCGYRFELFHHFYDSDAELQCPVCGEKSPEKQFSPFSASGTSCGTTAYSGG